MKTQITALGKLSLAIQQLPSQSQAKPEPAPVDHIIVIDISGSMYADLPKLRVQLKNKLSSLVALKDTVSILWFSGRGEYGLVVEQLEIHSVKDISSLHQAIDRYLKPIGLTGFKEPLQEVSALIDRLSAMRKNAVTSLFFMSDGYDNQWSDREILSVCKSLEPRLGNAAVVEFGWNCNRPLMAKMAEALGGNLLFSKDLAAYELTFEAEIGRGGATKKVPVQLASAPANGYAFALHDGSLLTFEPDADGVVLVPEGVKEIAYLTEAAGKPFSHKSSKSPLFWALLATLSQRMQSDTILDVLSVLGDVGLVATFSSCFSKEDYIRFQDEAMACAKLPQLRYADGYDANAVPKEDAYTVLQMLGDLAASDDNLFYPYHEAFSYQRIGAASVAREQGAKFTPANKGAGYPINGLVWSEDRPNVSLRVRIEGSVELPEDRPASLPAKVPSFIYRNYTVIRDGIVHTRKLPVSLTEETFTKLQANGLLSGEAWAPGKVFVLDFPKLPVINRRMVKGVTAEQTFATVLELELLAGAQKVFNDLQKRFAPKKSATFELLFGAEATEYLKGLGLTEYNGFNPPSTSVKSGDVYMARTLSISAKGLSSLPAVSAAEASLKAGKKLKVSEFVMSASILRVQAFLDSEIFKSAADKDALLATWVAAEAKAIVKRKRALTEQLAQSKFAVVVGHTWFTDMASLDDATREVELLGYGPVQVTAKLAEVAIET